MDDKYKAMLFGVALFVGGMITLLIISKFLKQEEIAPPQNGIVTAYPTVTLKPTTEVPPAGELMDLHVHANEQVTELFTQNDGFPWTSFDMDNLGPDPVYLCVNAWKAPQAPISAGGSIHVDLKRQGAIKKVYLKCDAGNTANINFYIIR